MDILISSNLERLLFELADAGRVRDWMASLASDGRFQVDRETFRLMREHFIGDWVSNDESLGVISRVFDETGYLMDPHTAVAWEVAERLRDANPVLVVSTAHWAKFGADVYKALTGLLYGDPLPADTAGLSGVQLLGCVQELAETARVPASLAELDAVSERFSGVVDAGRDGVEGAVREWLG